MFRYYLNLALRSFGHNLTLTILMVVAIGLGIGASMTTFTVFNALSGDPIPGKSDRLFQVQLDPGRIADYKPNEEPADQLTRYDAEALLRDKKAFRQAMMTGGSGVLRPESTSRRPFVVDMRYTSADFFSMFDTPFRHGQGWSAEDDDQRSRIAVIARRLSDRLFENTDSIGKTVNIDGASLRIVGVIDDWSPKPHFYDLNTGRFTDGEQVFVPFSTAMDLQLKHKGWLSCYGDEVATDPYAISAPCFWIQYWVELDDASAAADYSAYLVNYSTQQRSAGRFERPPNVRLRNVTQWLDYKQVVPSDVRLQLWLALAFLLVCLINTVGLLLAKFLRRNGDIAVRRALGASRGDIFRQYLTEAGAIGLAGGIVGLGFALFGLWAVRQQPTGYSELAYLNPQMLMLTFVLALLTSLLAGLLPAWRACQVAPAIQLKSQ